MKIEIERASGEPISLAEDRIFTNDVIFPDEYNPHNVGLWVVGNEYGVLGAVWGSESEIVDTATDTWVDEAQEIGLMDSFILSPEDAEEREREGWEISYIGNASEPADLQYLWMEEVDLSLQSKDFIEDLREAKEEALDTLADLREDEE